MMSFSSAILLLALIATIEEPANNAAFDRATTREVVSAAAQHIRQSYVLPDVGAALAADLETKLRAGAYDRITSGEALAARLTADLQSTSKDKHLRLTFSESPRQQDHDTAAAREERRLRMIKLGAEVNYGFDRVEILAGNVGYLALDGFWHLEFGGGDTAAAAMSFLVNTDALIIDLRESVHGGDPEMALLIASYFFINPVHLSDFYSRPENETRQWWTLAHVPGERYLDKLLFILTSQRTFSAGEGFAYDLQALKRAKIVGERTAGAAHPEQEYPLPANFTLELPFARSINMVTKTDWEGTGVVPDVEVTAAAALNVAHVQALELLVSRPGSNRLLTERKKALADLRQRP